jgi:hypothetical protein
MAASQNWDIEAGTTRRGLEALVELGGKNVTFLVIHLKSGCHERRLRHGSAELPNAGRPGADPQAVG